MTIHGMEREEQRRRDYARAELASLGARIDQAEAMLADVRRRLDLAERMINPVPKTEGVFGGQLGRAAGVDAAGPVPPGRS